MGKYKFVQRKVNFADCGLDINCNILQAPLCPCGCGNYMDICIEEQEALYDLISDLLFMQDCNHCAIFVLHNDGKTVTVGDSDGERATFISFCDEKTNALNIDLVRDWQNEFQFHCYGLMEQRKDGKSYRIVME